MRRIALTLLALIAACLPQAAHAEVTAGKLVELGETERPPIAIDNTFLGPLWAKPLRQGADLSVYSLTKYAGTSIFRGEAHVVNDPRK